MRQAIHPNHPLPVYSIVAQMGDEVSQQNCGLTPSRALPNESKKARYTELLFGA